MDEHSGFSGLLVIVLIAVGVWFWYDHSTLSSKITADEQTSSSQQSQASTTNSVPLTQDSSPSSPTTTVFSPLQRCIAQDDAKYWKIDYDLVQMCEKFGYSYEDYQNGTCQLPSPDLSQTMLARRLQRLSALHACEQMYGMN